jgi:hypothetical protein
MVAGTYDMIWYDCVTGKTQHDKDQEISAGRFSRKRPVGFGDELALYLARSDGKVKAAVSPAQKPADGNAEKAGTNTPETPNKIPVAPDQRISTKIDTPVDIQLTYNDPDGGPGPYTTSIILQPSYGKLAGMGNDQTYTPVRGYTGTDSFTWKVNDGAGDSRTSTIYISIEN